MTKKSKASKSSKQQANATSPTGSNPSAAAFNSTPTPTEKISVAINIGSHSCTVAYYNVNDQKAIIISNPDGFYATPTTVTPIDTDHGMVDTFGRAWNSTNNQKTMFFGSTDKKNEPLMENMIRHMIHIAEDYTGKSVENILLITPVNYTAEQNQVLERIIIQNLRLNLLQIASEPLLACMAYEFDKPVGINVDQNNNSNNNNSSSSNNNSGDQTLEGKRELIMVLDYGFQTSRASLVIRHVDTGLLTLLHSETSNVIGGDQIDQCVLDYVITEISKKYFNNRLSAEHKQILSDPNSRVVRKLKQCIETAKTTLSTSNVNRANISAESLLDGIDVNIDLLRGRFEMAADKVFNQAPTIVQQCLDNAKRAKVIPATVTALNGIDRVVLIGGTSKVIKLKQNVLKQFGLTEDDKTKYFDGIEYAPTVGGAMQSNLIIQKSQQGSKPSSKKSKKTQSKGNKKNQSSSQPQKTLFDEKIQVPCVPLSISLSTHGDGMVSIFPRFTSVPAEKELVVSNSFDDQQYMLVRIVQGERVLASENKEIGLYILQLVNSADLKERGEIECKLLFSIDEEGELSVEIDEPDDDSDKQVEPQFVLHNVKVNNGSVSEDIEQAEQTFEEDNEADFDDEADAVFDPKKLEIIEKEVNEMLKQAIEAHDADMEAFVNKDARTKLENYCYKCRRTLREQFSTDTAKIQLVNDYTSQTLTWINDNPDLTKTQYLSKLHEFHAWFQQIKQ